MARSIWAFCSAGLQNAASRRTPLQPSRNQARERWSAARQVAGSRVPAMSGRPLRAKPEERLGAFSLRCSDPPSPWGLRCRRTRPSAASRTWGPFGMPPILLSVALKRSGNAPGMRALRLRGGFLDDPKSPRIECIDSRGRSPFGGHGWRGSTGGAPWLRLAATGSPLSNLSIHVASIRLVRWADHRDC